MKKYDKRLQILSVFMSMAMMMNSMSLSVLANAQPTTDVSAGTVSGEKPIEQESIDNEEVIEEESFGSNEPQEYEEGSVQVDFKEKTIDVPAPNEILLEQVLQENMDKLIENKVSVAEESDEITQPEGNFESIEFDQNMASTQMEEPAKSYAVDLEESIKVTEFPELQTTSNGISFFSDSWLKEGNYERWIDRLADLPEYATDFYEWLEENSDNDGHDDALIEIEQASAVGDGYSYQIVSFNGELDVSFPSAQPTQDEINQAVNEAYKAQIGDSIVEAEQYILTTFSAFDRDRPEVFWLSGSSQVLSSKGFGGFYIQDDSSASVPYTTNVYFALSYGNFDIRADEYQDADAIKNDITERDALVVEITSTADGSRKEQLQSINNRLTTRNCYNSSSNLNNINHDVRECLGALRGKAGTVGPVCEGYARAFKVLCDKLNIPCVLVDGQAKNSSTSSGEAHMWNYVQMDDENWYAVDVTWNDPVVSGSSAAVSGAENENWFLLGSDTVVSGMSFLTSHPVSNTVTQNGIAFTNGPVLAKTKYGEATNKIIASGTCGTNLTWTLSNDGVLTISGSGKMTEFGGYSALPWKNYVDNITSVVIRDGVTSIGSHAFFNCENMLSIDIPDSVASIGEYAFTSCISLSGIDIPDAVSEIPEGVFYNCFALDNVVVPGSVTSIGKQAFYKCSSLTTITIPKSVTSIGQSAFQICNKLTDVYYGGTEEEWPSVSIGESNSVLTSATIHYAKAEVDEEEKVEETKSSYTYSDNADGTISITGCDRDLAGDIVLPSEIDGKKVSRIAKFAFQHCTELSSVVIPQGIITIDVNAFYGCSNLVSVYIPSSVTSIGTSAFLDCFKLTEIVIPDGVTVIKNSTFGDCNSLTTVTIPNSVTTIEDYAFYGCSELDNVYYEGTAEDWANISIGANNTPLSRTTIHYTKEAYYLFNYSENADGTITITGCKTEPTGDLEIPGEIGGKKVSAIGYAAFKEYDSLTSVMIPDSVTSIGEIAFFKCSGLLTIVIPDTLTSIGCAAFYKCSSLNNVSIPVGVTSIEDSTFYYCDSLTDVYYNGNREQWTAISIAEKNDNLTSATIHFTEEDPTYTYTENEDGTITLTGCEGELIGDVTLPSEIDGKTVTAIDGPFVSQNQLTSAVIPDTVIEIDNVFRDCAALESVTIPASVQRISSGDDPFWGCNALEEFVLSGENHAFTFENGMLCYDDHVVHCVKNVEGEVSLPVGTTFVNHGAFNDCTNMTIINIPATVSGSEWNLYIGAFDGCTSLTTINYAGTEAQWNILGVAGTVPEGVTINCTGVVTYTYTENTDGTLTLTGYTGDLVGEVTLPSELDGKKVTVLDNGAIRYFDNLTSLIIPEGYVLLKSNSVADCAVLESVTLPNSVNDTKGGFLFVRCPKLKEFKLSSDNDFFIFEDGVLRTDYALIACLASKTGSYKVPDGISSVQSGAFWGSGLTEVILPSGLDTIYKSAFHSCNSLTTVHLPSSLSEIRDYAFYGCTSLSDVYYEGTENRWNTVSIGAYNDALDSAIIHYGEPMYLYKELDDGTIAITGHTDLLAGNITLPSTIDGKTVTMIEWQAFMYQSEMTSIRIPETVTNISGNVFYGCESLTTIYWPLSAQTCAPYIIYGCDNLKEIIYAGTQYQWDKWVQPDMPALPESVTLTCKGEAVYTYSENDDGTLTLTGYTDYLNGVVNLPSEIGGKTVTVIGWQAFKNQTELISVVIPETVTTLHGNLFAGCTELTTIHWPVSVKYCNPYVFTGCSNLKNVVYSGTEYQWDKVVAENSYENSLGQHICKIPDGAILTCTGEAVYTYTENDDGTLTLTGYTDYLQDNVILPSTIDGKMVTGIALTAFSVQTKVDSVIIPNTVTNLGAHAFADCTDLTSVTIPSSVTLMGGNPFLRCTSLKNIILTGEEHKYLFEDGVLYNSLEVYTCLTSKTGTYTVPDGITSISGGAFWGSGLTEITLPSGLKTIYKSAFNSCSSLTTVYLPNSLVDIQAYAFDNCTALKDVYYNGTEEDWAKISIGEYNEALDNATIYFTEKEPEYTYIVNNDGTITLTGYTGELIDEVTFPSEIDGEPIWAVIDLEAYGGFGGFDKITKVTIPEGISYMEGSFFKDCTSLVEINLPESLSEFRLTFLCPNLQVINYRGTEEQWHTANKSGYQVPEGVELNFKNSSGTEDDAPASGSITVVGNDENVNVNITMTSENGANIPVTVKENGSFYIGETAEGTYTLRIEADGYVTREEIVTVWEDGSVNMGELKLCKLGDINMDGDVTTGDVDLLFRRVGKTEGYETRCADINNDGIVTTGDVDLLFRTIK